MNLTWFGSPTDCEFDLTASVARNPDVNLTLYVLSDPFDQHNTYHLNMLTKAPNITIHEIVGDQLHLVCEQVAEETTDLIVMRHPVWISDDDKARTLINILKNQPLVMWTWEWLPNLYLNQLPQLYIWPRIAVTNSQDKQRCISQFPNIQSLYLPFGIVNRTKEELIYNEEYASDIVCDAQPHYECCEYESVKRQSVNQMIKPVLDLPYKLSLWGSRYGETTNCDWGSTPEFKPFHRGNFPTLEYPKVYTSSKIYLGVTWNWKDGGFSIRLARALGCGIMTIWQQTKGGVEDFPEKIFEWSTNPKHTRDLVEHYMTHDDERQNLARLGKEYGVQHLEWCKQLKRLTKEII